MKRRIGMRVLRLALSRAAHTTKAVVGAFMLGTLAGVVLSRIETHRRRGASGAATWPTTPERHNGRAGEGVRVPNPVHT
jgi:hypothetical protein